MSSTKAEQSSRYQTFQILLLVFSFIFFFIIAYGYYNLLLNAGVFLAVVGGALIAVFAWYLARAIGTSPKGARGIWILFIPLLIISAAGVYNTLMLYLEGSRIIVDATTDSQEQFDALDAAAGEALEQSGATAKRARIETLADALYREIRNPLKCGQGPVAGRLIGELQRELQGFTALSTRAGDCSQNDQVIADYQERITGLLDRAAWNNPDLNAIQNESKAARDTLGELRSTATTGYSPASLQSSLVAFDELDTQYRDLRSKLSRHASVREIDEGLHISEVQSLGNVAKLPALFLERLDEVSTYAYLGAAVGFDLLMVFLFQLVTANKVRRYTTANDLPGAW